MKRRAAVEPVIGHLKAEHRMDRNHFKGPQGDRINAVLAGGGRLQLQHAPAVAVRAFACLILELARTTPVAQAI
jgi:hypothetical protein